MVGLFRIGSFASFWWGLITGPAGRGADNIGYVANRAGTTSTTMPVFATAWAWRWQKLSLGATTYRNQPKSK